MKEVVIHIGYHKSASTLLQNKFFPQLPANYLLFAGPNRKYLDMIESNDEFDADKIRHWINSEIMKKYHGNKRAITVLSHEELSGHPHGYRTICPFTTANNLKKTFPNAKILIIIRNQLDYITSIYTFRVAIKGYESRSFNRFILEEGGKGLFTHLEYHRLIKHYQHLFGRQQVCVIPMELLSETTEDLFNAIKIPYQKIDIGEPINVSTKAIFVLSFWRPVNYMFERLLNTLIFLFGKKKEKYPFRTFRYLFYSLKRRITKVLNKIFLVTKRIDIKRYSEYSELLHRFGKSNAYLEKIIDCNLSNFGYSVKK